VAGDVVGQIVDRVRSGELKVGDVLPGERVLAAQMDVSRPTVSAAMGRLAEAGVLKSRPGRQGNAEIISIWIPEGLHDAAGGVGELEADDIFRVLEARKTLEPRIAQLAAFRATDDDYLQLQESIDLLTAHAGDITRAAQAERLFHRTMWRAARNSSLQTMMIGLEKELAPIHDMMLRTPEDYSAGIELHTATLAALKRGDPAEIEEEMYRHLGHFEAIVADVLERTPHRKTPAFLLAGAH
jgi:GntR family transcriptional regulator, transcriptional repressor for pyruvate dehydrogenase complex